MTRTSPLRRVGRFTLLLLMSWCVMNVVHECGHIVCGWASGGTLDHADIAPWSLPHSSFHPNPWPLVTLWGGPLLGGLVPLVVALRIRRPWAWFIAWFCVLANGMYLAIAWYAGEPELDTARLLRQGAPPWTIAIYCVATIGPGYVGFRREYQRMLAKGASVTG